MINKKKYTRQEVEYTTFESSNLVDSALTMGNEKFVLNGIPAIQVMRNSYKYDSQIQITVYKKIGLTRKAGRVPYATDYDRIEIFMGKEDFEKLCVEYFKSKREEEFS